MTNVTIFGSGNMGSAIDSVLSAGGASVDHIGSADPPGPVNGDIVILAVYHPALEDILDKYGEQLAGKIVVDITNPMNLETFDSLVVPADSSEAAELAAALPTVIPGDQGVQHHFRGDTCCEERGPEPDHSSGCRR